jgi:hypothetical protein
MLRNIIFVLAFCVTTSVLGQENFFNKEYTNSNASLEFGLGYVFKTQNENSLVRYQVASRNILLYKKLGFSYTIEYPLDEGINPKSTANEMNDLFGLNYRISNNLSFQYGIGLASNVFSEKGKRKAISLAYHPDNYPFTITTGYSESFGPSLTVSYRVIFSESINIKNMSIPSD